MKPRQLDFYDFEYSSALGRSRTCAGDSVLLTQPLLRGLVTLNVSLAVSRKHHLTDSELLQQMNASTDKLLAGRTVAELVSVGSGLGLILRTKAPQSFVFPVARMLAHSPISFPSLFIDALADRIVSAPTSDQLQSVANTELVYALETLDQKWKDVLAWRFGLWDEEPQTLETVGLRLGITRERVRQIQNKALESLRRPTSLRSLQRSLVLLTMARRGSLLADSQTPELGQLRLLTEIMNMPLSLIDASGMVAVGVDIADIDDLFDHLDPMMQWMDTQQVAQVLSQTKEWCLGEDDMLQIADRFVKQHTARLTKVDRAVMVLESLGRAAHCSEIYAKYCEMFPEHQTTVRNLHAVLSRGEKGIVWVGMRSTFALSRWGYQRPTAPLFDEVFNIVLDIYQRTQKAVPFVIIQGEMSKRRTVCNPNSVAIAACRNPRIHWSDEGGYVPGPRPASLDKHTDQERQSVDELLRAFERTLHDNNELKP